MDPVLIDGPKTARCQLILAHGAGAPMDSDFMNVVAQGLAAEKIRVVRFEFSYMAKRRKTGKAGPPDRGPALEAAWREAVEAHPHPVLAIGGKSLGGRIAARMGASLAVRGVVCLGFPFHPPARPEKLRLDDLSSLAVPTLIVQGTRDPFGTREEVAGYTLPRCARVHWLEDGDHSFEPRKSSGHTHEEHLATAVRVVAEWMRGLGAGR